MSKLKQVWGALLQGKVGKGFIRTRLTEALRINCYASAAHALTPHIVQFVYTQMSLKSELCIGDTTE